MIDDNTTAVLHIFQETAVRLFRPRISVIIQHYQLVRAKVEHKTGHILACSGEMTKSTSKRPEFSRIVSAQHGSPASYGCFVL